jgi:hypothetical protein
MFTIKIIIKDRCYWYSYNLRDIICAIYCFLWKMLHTRTRPLRHGSTSLHTVKERHVTLLACAHIKTCHAPRLCTHQDMSRSSPVHTSKSYVTLLACAHINTCHAPRLCTHQNHVSCVRAHTMWWRISNPQEVRTFPMQTRDIVYPYSCFLTHLASPNNVARHGLVRTCQIHNFSAITILSGLY